MLLNNRYLVAFSRLFIKSFTFNILLFTAILADDFHYNNMLIGDRASGLAGAYTAIADDPSGLFYNPAGVVYSPTSNISANMNAYNVSKTRYKKVLGEHDWERTSQALVPNFFGITQPLGPGTLGFSYAVTDSILEDQDQTFSDIPTAGTKFNINFNNQDTTSNIGPSYSLAISEKFSVGLTLYGYYRTQEQIFNQSFDFPDNTYHWENVYIAQEEYGVKPILGFMFTPANKVSLGLAITKTFLLHSKLEQQTNCATTFLEANEQTTTCTPDAFQRVVSKNDNKREFPWTISMGAAYFASKELLLTTNASIYEAKNDTIDPLINVAAGLEYYFSGRLAIRMGGYTNFANTPNIKEGTVNFYNEHVDIFGATMSLTHFTRASSISFGMAGSYGKGKAQIISGNTAVQDVEYMGISVYISASNSF